MRAVYYERFGVEPYLADVAEPHLPDDGVIIQVKASGLCRSDWHGWMGNDPDIQLPHVPGHEFAGVIAEKGAIVQRWRIGDRVTVPFAVGCGRCNQCLSGNQHICDDYYQPGFTAWGSFAEFVAIPHADVNLVRVPEEIGFEEASILGCRFATAFRAVIAQGRIRAGECLAVFGCGGVGLSAIMIGGAVGADVIAVDVNTSALDAAKSLGAAHVMKASAEEYVVEQIRALTGGGAHVSIDALGSEDTCVNSVLALRKKGRHVQVGLMVADYKEALIPMNVVLSKELEILGSHGMQAHEYPRMIEMIRSGSLNPKLLISNAISLDEAPHYLATMGDFPGIGVTVINKL